MLRGGDYHVHMEKAIRVVRLLFMPFVVALASYLLTVVFFSVRGSLNSGSFLSLLSNLILAVLIPVTTVSLIVGPIYLIVQVIRLASGKIKL